MKKNLRFAFALMLALVLMTALSVPAFAADTDIFALDGTDGSYDGSLWLGTVVALLVGVVFFFMLKNKDKRAAKAAQ